MGDGLLKVLDILGIAVVKLQEEITRLQRELEATQAKLIAYENNEKEGKKNG